jgi:hypothetical protein
MKLRDREAMGGIRDSEDREVDGGVCAFYGGRKRSTIGKNDLEGAAAADDVLVGEHAAGGVKDDARTLATGTFTVRAPRWRAQLSC